MSHPGFGRSWKQPELSDVDIVLLAGREDVASVVPGNGPVASNSDQLQVLQQFPGHTHLLIVSEYFEAQVGIERPAGIQMTCPRERMAFNCTPGKHTPEARCRCPALWSQCALHCVP
jgi:hypothetical protein